MKPEILKFDFRQQLDNPDTLELYIYSDVCGDGWEWWTGQKIESETSADFFRRKLSAYKDIKHINLYINSSGGSVREGYGIYAQLKRHEAQKTVYVDGFANSIASIIAMAGDKIIMYANSVMGIHNMMDWCFGNASEHRKVADNIDAMMQGNRQVYLERSGGKITEEKLTELLDAETILTAQECLTYGFCDEISQKAADSAKIAEAMQRINADMAAQVKYFATLKQSFGDAMMAAKPPAPLLDDPAVRPEDLPEEPPKENKTIQFLNALMGGK